MKANNLLVALCLMLSTLTHVTAQKTKEKTIEFHVTGNCEMCKKTIESSLKNDAGVKSAVWNQKTKIVKVTFNPDVITEAQIHGEIVASGYDTEKQKASDGSYEALPQCCQYKRKLQEGEDVK